MKTTTDAGKTVVDGQKAGLLHQNTVEMIPEDMEIFQTGDDMQNPLKVKITIRTLEKVETVYFEELSDDPSFSKEQTQTSFWIEAEISRLQLIQMERSFRLKTS